MPTEELRGIVRPFPSQNPWPCSLYGSHDVPLGLPLCLSVVLASAKPTSAGTLGFLALPIKPRFSARVLLSALWLASISG